jgi:hypothetical protein
MPALYLTIWIALALFAAGESGRSLARPGSRPPAWAWWAFTTGLVLAIVHTVVAFDLVHQWVHADALRATAAQTQAVLGVSAGWGLYVNYVFLAVWLGDAWYWRVAPDHVRPRALVWSLRAFYAIVIFNGAVVFAAGLRRIAGVLLVSWLARVWTAHPSAVTPSPSSPRR